jgi:hypothetical protein
MFSKTYFKAISGQIFLKFISRINIKRKLNSLTGKLIKKSVNELNRRKHKNLNYNSNSNITRHWIKHKSV